MSLPSDSGPDARARHYGERLLGLFFRAWAHELNNPVQAVLAGAELIDMELHVPGANLDSVREQVGGQARELATEVMRVSDGITRLHALSRPLEAFEGRSDGAFVVAEAIALWSPVSRHAGVRTRVSDAQAAAPLVGLPVDAACVVVLGALAAIARAEPGPQSIELSWGVRDERPTLQLTHGGVEARFFDPELWRSLIQLARVEAVADADALELRFSPVSDQLGLI